MEKTYANSASNTLILLNVLLSFLNFGASIIIHKLHPHVLLSTSQLWCIHGYKQALYTSFLGMLNIFLGDLAISIDISARTSACNQGNGRHLHLQLEEENLARSCSIENVVK